MAAPVNSQAVLVGAICAGVSKSLAETFAEMSAQRAKDSVTLNTILARLEGLSADGVGLDAKRAVRTAAGAKAPTKAKAKGKADDGVSKVTNAMLFMRHCLANDLDGFRQTYAGQIEDVRLHEKVQKVNEAANPVGWWNAVGSLVWTDLSDALKNEVRAAHVAWKESAARDNADAPLEAEPADDE